MAREFSFPPGLHGWRDPGRRMDAAWSAGSWLQNRTRPTRSGRIPTPSASN